MDAQTQASSHKRDTASPVTDTEMNRRLEEAYGGILRRVFAWAFNPVIPPAELGPQLRQLSDEGVVVHVSRSASFVTFLFFQHLFLRLGIPVAKGVSGLASSVWRPWGRLVAGKRGVRAPYGSQVGKAVAEGNSALVFMRPANSLYASTGTHSPDPLPSLVAAQRQYPRPIFLLPQLVMWERRPLRLRKNLLDILFGEPESPGLWRSLFSFIRNRNRAFIRTGDPLDLRAYVQEHEELSDKEIAHKLRGILSQQISREMRVVTGPPFKSPDRIVLETLRDRTLRAAIAEEARERGRADGSVEKEAEQVVREIAARYTPLAIDIARWVLNWVFNRIYDGIEVHEEGLAKVGKANAKAPLVVCPTHKSHVDYLILSYVFYINGLTPPHIAAGKNLDFFPLGPIFRKCGAFFIRRTFRGDRIYGAALRAYIRKLLRDGYSQEFFVEGTRSRSGKVLLPKFGMLSMEVDAWIDGARPDIAFAPVWIGYARIIEERSYEEELSGKEKRKEDLSSLIKAPQVLVSRYGRIHIRFDDPISLAQLAEGRGFDKENHNEEQKRDLVRALGFRIVEGMNRAAVLTPSSLLCVVLLSSDEGSFTGEELRERATFFADLVLSDGGQLSFPAAPEEFDPKGNGHLGEARASLERDKAIVVSRDSSGPSAGANRYTIPASKRMRLDYYKNIAIHYFAADAIIATALLSCPSSDEAAIRAHTLELSRLLKNEFIYGAGTFNSIFDERVERLVRQGLIARGSVAQVDQLFASPQNARQLRWLADLLKNFIESYLLASESLLLLLSGPRDYREWLDKALEKGRADFQSGKIGRAESLSKANIESAFRAFEGFGLLERCGDKNRSRKLAEGVTRDLIESRLGQVRSFLLPQVELLD